MELKSHIGAGRLAKAALAVVFTCALSFQAAPVAAYGAQVVAAGVSTAKLATTTWPDYRGSSTNNAVTDAATPRTTGEAGLIWSVQFEDGYVSPEIIVDDEVVVTSGRGSKGKITKLNKKTGKVTAEADMRTGSAYSLIPPTYADGKIFVTLSGGGIEAFDAKTLKSLWYYRNDAGGQGNCPIVYSDGCVYTGYWSGETTERSFVCVNAKNGKLVWERSNAGGYYWAGALVVGDYVLFGCDDGKAAGEVGTSCVRCANKATGEVVSSMEVEGDQRSSIVYDSGQGRIYFTSKPGYLYSAKLDPKTGSLTGRQSLKIDKESAATPLVYEGRVYVGASSGAFSEGSLSVVDAASLKLLYKLDNASGIGGTVKSAPLLSTAYAGKGESSDGKLYLYLTTNYLPGGITMVAVEPGSTKASQAKVVSLFTPPASMQQYCIASVICDNDGNLYYKNDSNYVMCVGPGGKGPADIEDPSNGQTGDPSNNPSKNQSGDPSNGGDGSSGQANSNSGSGSASGGGESGSSATGSTRRSGPIQNEGAPASATGGAARSGSDRKATVADESKTALNAVSEGKKKDARSADQGDSARHTDAVAATERLDDEPEQGTPEWLASAIIAGVAVAAFAAALVARVVSARRNPEGEGSDAA